MRIAKCAKLQVAQFVLPISPNFMHESGTNFVQKSMVNLVFKNMQLICLSGEKVVQKNVDEIDPRLALLARGVNKDCTVWLDGARPPPNFQII